MNPNAADETALIKAYQQGDKRAAEAIFRRYHPMVHALATRMLGNAAEVDDAVQEAFIRAFRGLKTFRGDSSLKTWIYRVATNVCLTQADKIKRTQPYDSLDDPLGEEGGETRGSQIPSGERPPDEVLLGEELGDKIQAALAKLSPEFRAVLILRDVEGLSYEEVAATTGANLGTVKSRLARARTQAMRWLKEYLG
ncbi:MAG TPA: sigma-70 family RNA polymerase sigma factor [Pantanalinema sp.]